MIAPAPIVKMPGGKTRLLHELLPRIPPLAATGRYFEPFCGGAAVFFALAPMRAVIADANADLIATYRAVAADVEAVIAELEQFQRRHSERNYLATRAAWNRGARTPATFLYLNRTCFNGLWRVNRAGEFNVGPGKYRDPFGGIYERLRAAAPMLACSELRTGSYVDTLADAAAGDVVYLDSPYDAGWTAYTAAGFTDADQAELAFTVRTLAARGVRCVVSNADTPRIRALYAGLQIDVVRCTRSVNCDGAGRGAVDEVIVTTGGSQGRGPAQADAIRDGPVDQVRTVPDGKS